jgi:WD40 repeat protein
VTTINLFPGPGQYLALAVLQDGALAGATSENLIEIWNTTNTSLTKRLTGHTDFVQSLIVLPNGLLVSGGGYFDKTIGIWNVTSEKIVKNLTGHSNVITSLALLSDDDDPLLASGSWDFKIKIWNITSAKIIKTLKGHTSLVTSLVVLPDGLLASGSYDKTVLQIVSLVLKLFNFGKTYKRQILNHHTR